MRTGVFRAPRASPVYSSTLARTASVAYASGITQNAWETSPILSR